MVNRSEQTCDTGAKRALAVPGASGYPLVGLLPQVLLDPLQALLGVVKRHGDVACVNVGFEKIYLLSHPDHVEHVFHANSGNFIKDGSMWAAGQQLAGNGLGTTEGSAWLRQRRMMQPQFHRQKLAVMTSLLAEAAAEGLEAWRPAAENGQPIELLKELKSISTHTFLRALLSTSINAKEMSELTEAVNVAFRHINVLMWTNSLPQWLPIPGSRRFQQARRTIDRIIYPIIRSRYRQPCEGGDLLDLLLVARDADTGEGMSEQQVRDELVTLLVAAHETTATALAWTVHFLCGHPEAAQRVAAEASSLAGDRPPEFADLGKLAYTKMAFQEAMRLKGPLWLTVRRAVAEDNIAGYRIPAGSLVAIVPYVIHRHPAIWQRPEAFEPERFTEANAKGRHRGAYLPFGAGGHLCIGKSFATMQAQLLLAMLFQRYRVSLVPGHKVELQAAIVLRPRNGILVTLAPA
ncbi:Epi-isozizaene 5-monooxygenase/(E)-beta-farnesene synthase [Variovorax sp. PBL-H6]|uniref:cytochrome P450 n=1 Tax=Variovorax sp. PBL-H6 TaxID=434009 RepID=UPI00131826C6|nr:cytochrome P450 [Variovorax sp. PBL-H6]VTU15056.1 Epi-isozizaene 5-monooxygenase/(E)-beta-farnesene synthase [Variovorax sp. PBL-H6]